MMTKALVFALAVVLPLVWAAPSTTTMAPKTTEATTATAAPKTTMATTTDAPKTTDKKTTEAPKTTTMAPKTTEKKTTEAPKTTTEAPKTTTGAPKTTDKTTEAPKTTTDAPKSTTEAPKSTDKSTTAPAGTTTAAPKPTVPVKPAVKNCAANYDDGASQLVASLKDYAMAGNQMVKVDDMMFELSPCARRSMACPMPPTTAKPAGPATTTVAPKTTMAPKTTEATTTMAPKTTEATTTMAPKTTEATTTTAAPKTTMATTTEAPKTTTEAPKTTEATTATAAPKTTEATTTEAPKTTQATTATAPPTTTTTKAPAMLQAGNAMNMFSYNTSKDCSKDAQEWRAGSAVLNTKDNKGMGQWAVTMTDMNNDDNTMTVLFNCDLTETSASGKAMLTTDEKSGDVTLTINTFLVCQQDKAKLEPKPVAACEVTYEKFDRTYETSLDKFLVKANNDLNDFTFSVNPCAAETFDSAALGTCTGKGYLAYNDASGSGECVVLDDKNTTYFPEDEKFVTVFSKKATNHLLQATQSVSVTVGCGATEQLDQQASTNTDLVFTDPTVCGVQSSVTEAPPATTVAPQAPAPAKKSGLSTGEIVGIVIGALALIVIILVCLRWRSSKSQDEGEYQRV